MKRVFSRPSQSFALTLALSLTVAGSGVAHADLMSKMNPMNWMPGKSQETQQDTTAGTEALRRAAEANAQADQALKAAQEALLRAEQVKKQAEALQAQAKSVQSAKPVVQDPTEATESPAQSSVAPEAVAEEDEKSSWYKLKLFKKSATQQPEQHTEADTSAQAEENTATTTTEAGIPENALTSEEATEAPSESASAEKELEEDPVDSKPSASTPWNPMTWFSKPSSEAATANVTPETLPTEQKDVKAASGEVDLKTKAVIMETEKGNITFELFPDEAPATVANIAKLIEDGFYNRFNMKFHRVIPGFVVQTGDPTGTGAGGSKDRIPLEAKNKLSHNAKGIVAMARGADPNSATSQFYITLAPQTSLDGKYAVFGKVIAGLDVLEKIEKDDMLYGIRLIDIDNVVRDQGPEKKKFFSSLF